MNKTWTSIHKNRLRSNAKLKDKANKDNGNVKNKSILNLTSKKAHIILDMWANQYIESKKPYINENNPESILNIQFNDSLTIKKAGTKHNIGKPHIITIGTKEISAGSRLIDRPIRDTDFIDTVVALYHEIAHYEQHIMVHRPKAELISELSKFGNEDLYFENWHLYQHEIDAEHNGVINTYARLKQLSPEHADELMLNWLTNRANNTIYCIKVPEYSKDGKFESMEQVDMLFDEAYAKSPEIKRSFPKGYLGSGDEFIQMVTLEKGVLNPDYAAFFNQLVSEKSGAEFDRKMATVMAYLHPKLQEMYKDLDFKKFDMEEAFGRPMSESSDAIMERIDPSKRRILISMSVNKDINKEWDYKSIGQELEESLNNMKQEEGLHL